LGRYQESGEADVSGGPTDHRGRFGYPMVVIEWAKLHRMLLMR
jgi:hypothetical protein